MTIPLSLHPGKIVNLPPKPAPYRVYIGCPSYDGRYSDGVVQALFNAARSGVLDRFQLQSGSWLTKNYNACLAMALNCREQGVTHFAMLHEDILPQSPDWLLKMLILAEQNKADIISAVAPLKFEKGLTSTALDIDGRKVRRLTLHEVYNDYAPTFTDPNLLINTGLMLIDLRNSWVEKLHFEMKDGIGKDEKGRFFEWGIPEDWDVSRQAKQFGARIFATREVPLIHRGGGSWSNMSGWGTAKTDEVDVSLADEVLK